MFGLISGCSYGFIVMVIVYGLMVLMFPVSYSKVKNRVQHKIKKLLKSKYKNKIQWHLALQSVFTKIQNFSNSN